MNGYFGMPSEASWLKTPSTTNVLLDRRRKPEEPGDCVQHRGVLLILLLSSEAERNASQSQTHVLQEGMQTTVGGTVQLIPFRSGKREVVGYGYLIKGTNKHSSIGSGKHSFSPASARPSTRPRLWA